MKRIRYVVLILLVFALLLCGCSASDSKDPDVDYSEIDADLVTAPSVEYVIACLNNVDAITGIDTALHTLSSISRSKPFFTPSVSIEFTTISPAPLL